MLAAVLSALLPGPRLSTPSSDACAHCGLPCGERPILDDDGRRFCCAGCSTVYAAIQGAGLGAFYTEREPSLEGARPVRPSGRRFSELDDPALARSFSTGRDGTLAAELTLEGVHCAACVWLVESLPRLVRGACEARLDFGRSTAFVRWDPSETSLSEIGRTLDRLGYTPHAKSETDPHDGADRALLMRLGVTGAIAGNVMLMALALYSGAANDAVYSSFFRWGSFFLSIPAVLYGAAPFYRGARAALLARTPNMDLPIAIGVSAGFVSGAVNTLRGGGEIYFDTITTLIFLLLVGRWLGQKHARRAAIAADFASALAPSTARLVDGGECREVRAEAVPAGVLVEIRAGERVSVDGRVESGDSSVDASLLTGESAPVEVKSGDRVYAGTENLVSTLRVRAERVGRETRVGELALAMERSRRERAPIVRAADRIAGWFVLAVLALAFATLALWWRAGPSLAVEHAVALLVVTCPCALGMATPLAVSVALGRAARRGILFRGGEALEALARPAHFIFDKSGTLTLGRPELVDWRGDPDVAVRASAAERGCDHPLARAFSRAFPAPEALSAAPLERPSGAGVRARVDGRELVAGNLAFVEACGVLVPETDRNEALAHAAAGLTPVLVAENGRAAGVGAFGDALRPDARSSLFALVELGSSIGVLSGDHPLVVRRICRELPVSAWAGCVSPERKLAAVKDELAAGKRVVMVGDGVNDAPAMSAASVGFAVHGGAETTLGAADVFATKAGVAPVLEAVRGARLTLRAIHRGLAFALVYNAASVALAMTGVLSPLVAAVMMPLSSLTVLTSALHSRAFTGQKEASGTAS